MSSLNENGAPLFTVLWWILPCWNYVKQECIPVGCVPSAAIAVSPRAGVCLVPRGSVPWERCVCSGGCLVPGGLIPGGCLVLGGYVWLFGPGGGIPACTEADAPCGQTHACENKTFATSLRTVTKIFHFVIIWGPLSTQGVLTASNALQCDLQNDSKICTH